MTKHDANQKYLPAYFNKLVIIALQNLEKKVRARSVEMTSIFPQTIKFELPKLPFISFFTHTKQCEMNAGRNNNDGYNPKK